MQAVGVRRVCAVGPRHPILLSAGQRCVDDVQAARQADGLHYGPRELREHHPRAWLGLSARPGARVADEEPPGAAVRHKDPSRVLGVRNGGERRIDAARSAQPHDSNPADVLVVGNHLRGLEAPLAVACKGRDAQDHQVARGVGDKGRVGGKGANVWPRGVLKGPQHDSGVQDHRQRRRSEKQHIHGCFGEGPRLETTSE